MSSHRKPISTEIGSFSFKVALARIDQESPEKARLIREAIGGHLAAKHAEQPEKGYYWQPKVGWHSPDGTPNYS